MPKILRAYGPAGSHGQHWNWCEAGEPVNIHGTVCARSCHCGCDRSFIGINSATATTQAAVEEVSPTQFKQLRDRLHEQVMRGWNNSIAIASHAVGLFDRLSDELLAEFSPGDVLTVRKRDDHVTLTKVRLA